MIEKKVIWDLKSLLFKEYKLPLRAKAFSSIVFKGKVDSNSTEIYSAFIAKDIFKDKTLPKIDIKGAVIKLKGNFKRGRFFVATKVKLSLPMAKDIQIGSKIDLKTMNYVAKVIVPKLSLKDKKLSKELGGFKAIIKGSNKSFFDGA